MSASNRLILLARDPQNPLVWSPACVPQGFTPEHLRLVSHHTQTPDFDETEQRKIIRPDIWIFSESRIGWSGDPGIEVVNVPPNTPIIETLDGRYFAVYEPEPLLLEFFYGPAPVMPEVKSKEQNELPSI